MRSTGIHCAAALLCVFYTALAGAADTWPTHGWETATPADVGMDKTLLEEARDYALTGGGSGIITRHGKVVYSWGDLTELYDLKSTTKSIGVTALGLAVQDGLVNLTDAAQIHLPDVGVPPQTNSDTGWLSDITISHLATHTAGFDKTGGYIDLLFEPGTQWSYSDGGANWLADLLTVRFGTDLRTLMFARVFGPLGLTSADLFWRNHAYRDDTINGIKRREFGSGIRADVDAIARLGYLYLRGGLWEGDRVIPESFVNSVGQPVPHIEGLPVNIPGDFPQASSHYGLLWWNNGDGTLENVPTDAYWSWGLLDSFIIVIPSLDIVVARAGGRWRPGWDGDYSVIAPFIGPIAQSVLEPPPDATPSVIISSPADGTTSTEGIAVSFAGSASDSEDGDLTSALEWRSDLDGLVGTGGAFSTAILSVGTHAITASVTDSASQSASAAVSVTIVPASVNTPPVIDITAPADGTTIEEGDAIQFAGSASDAEDGNLSAGIEWTSSKRHNPIGTGATFTISTLEAGNHVVTASVTDSGGLTGSASITVIVEEGIDDDPPENTSPEVTIQSPADGFGVMVGEEIDFVGSASDAEDGDLSAGLLWTSSMQTGAIGTGSSFSISTLAVGTHLVTAEATDSGSLSGSASITVIVSEGPPNATPFVSISSPANGIVAVRGESVHFAGSANDPEDGNLTSGLEWRSDKEGLIGMGGSFSVSTLTSGMHTITASSTDSNGATGSSAITITITAAPAQEPESGGGSGGGGGAADLVCLVLLFWSLYGLACRNAGARISLRAADRGASPRRRRAGFNPPMAE